jgi:putative oxidoreductase
MGLIPGFRSEFIVKIIAVQELKTAGTPRALAVSGLLLRVLFGVMFVVSGALKAADPGVFLLDVRSFQILGDPWAAWLAMSLPWLEIICGLALAAGGWAGGALVILAAAIAVFIGALAQAWARGIDVTCGCFGRSENHTNFPLQIGFDIVLLAVAAFLLWLHLKLEAALRRAT